MFWKIIEIYENWSRINPVSQYYVETYGKCDCHDDDAYDSRNMFLICGRMSSFSYGKLDNYLSSFKFMNLNSKAISFFISCW